MTGSDSLADGETDGLARRRTDTQGCAVFSFFFELDSLFLHCESAFLNMNPVACVQGALSDTKASLSVRLKEDVEVKVASLPC